MKIALRPHHFLCLKGYKGQNYNKLQIINWNNISQMLERNPQTDIMIIEGKDELCRECSCEISKGFSYCKDKFVEQIDKQVAQILDIKPNETYKYSEIQKRLEEKINPQIHKQICELCSWWKKGLCRDSFSK